MPPPHPSPHTQNAPGELWRRYQTTFVGSINYQSYFSDLRRHNIKTWKRWSKFFKFVTMSFLVTRSNILTDKRTSESHLTICITWLVPSTLYLDRTRDRRERERWWEGRKKKGERGSHLIPPSHHHSRSPALLTLILIDDWETTGKESAALWATKRGRSMVS